MGNIDQLKKLIPMSDDENSEIIEDTPQVNTQLITDSFIDKITPHKSNIGDFSMNSFVIVDPIEEEETSDVYMESIIDMFKRLNNKIDNIADTRTAESHALEKIQGLLLNHDSINALNTIREVRNQDVGEFHLYSGFVNYTIPSILIKIKDELIKIKENSILIKGCYDDLENRYIKKAEENERLKNMISQQSKDHKIQIENLIAENNNIKDQLIGIHRENGTEGLDSLLEEDIVKGIKQLVSNKSAAINDLREEVLEKDEIIKNYNKRANSFEVTHLSTQVDSLKQTQQKLQGENINLTQIANKLSENNTKLKQELIFFNSELKKAMEMIARKNETITRQKNLIELFQEKIGGKNEFPIEELKKRKHQIEERLEKESDYFIKQRLRKEREDCCKRLSDFLNL